MKEKEFVCQVCGKTFKACATYKKYCDDCKKRAYNKRIQKYNQKCKVNTSDDTEEMRLACLNCTRPSCAGECEKLAALARSNNDG